MFPKIKRLLLFIIIIIFAVLALANIKNAGIHDDECMMGVLALEILTSHEIDIVSSVPIDVFGKQLPTNQDTAYTFQLPAYLYLPFASVMGINVLSLKMFSVLVNLLFLIMVFKVVKQYFDELTGYVTLALLAISFLFVHYSRFSGLATEPFNNLIFFVSLWGLLKYRSNRQHIYILLFFFMLGLGFSTKLSIVPRLLGLISALVFIYPHEIYNHFKSNSLRKHLNKIIFFCLGAFLFLTYNIGSGYGSFKLFKYLNFKNPTKTFAGIDNSNISRNLDLRIKQLGTILNEKLNHDSTAMFVVPEYVNKINSKVSPLSRKFMIYLYIIAFLFNLLVAMVLKYPTGYYKNIFFLYILYLVMFLSSVFSAGTLREFHLLMIYPFPQLLIAIFIKNIFNVSEFLKKNRFKIFLNICSIAMFLPVFIVNFQMHYSYLHKQIVSGGRGCWSGYSEQLVKYLKKNNIKTVYPLGPEIMGIGQFISNASIKFQSDYIGVKNLTEVTNITDDISDIFEEFYIIVEEQGYQAEKQSERLDLIFKYLSKNENKSALAIKEFYNNEGLKQYTIYKITTLDI